MVLLIVVICMVVVLFCVDVIFVLVVDIFWWMWLKMLIFYVRFVFRLNVLLVVGVLVGNVCDVESC